MRSRKPMIDWVTEYNYVSEKSLSEAEFMDIIEEKYTPEGQIYPPKKKKLTFGDGRVYYRHILKTVMF